MIVIAALSALVGVSIWFDRSTFAPFAQPDSISYVLCTPSLSTLIFDVLGSGLVLVAACIAVERRLLTADPRTGTRWRSASFFIPLSLGALNFLSIGLLVPALRDWWSPVAYVATSLRPIVWVLALGLVGLNLIAASGRTLDFFWNDAIRRLDLAGSSLLLDVAIAAVLAVLVVSTSPKIRFSGVPVGDEPKYLRYAENWWQGGGMDMDGVQDASAIPATLRGPALTRNFATLLPALRDDFSQLAGDAAYLGNWKHWGHQFNKATYVGNWFVTGKNGGLYEIHQPGISFVIFPAYAVDRWLFDRGQGRFADDLFTVNTVMLTIWLLIAIATFRLIGAVTGDLAGAAVATVACLASVPLGTFAFPFYPETMGALLVAWATRQIVAPETLSPKRAAVLGGALGWLVWLHVRFSVLSFVLVLWVAWTHRLNRRATAVVAASYATVAGMFCLYAYHVTGSLLPSALYDATPAAGFTWARVTGALSGVLFDRENGLFALAPVYLLAAPGLGLMWRQQRRTAVVLVTIVLALIVPVAGNGYETSGTSPLRYVVAIAPLLAVPIGACLHAIRGRRSLVALSAILALVSMHFAAAYNLQNDKTITQTIAAGIAGWDVSFLFPLIRRTGASGFDRSALLFWEMLALAAIAAGTLIRGRASPPEVDSSGGRRLAAVTAGLLGLAAMGCLAIAAGSPRRELRLLQTPGRSLAACRLACTGKPGALQIGAIPGY